MHQHVLSTPSIGSNELGGFGRFWTPNGPVVFPLSKWDFKDGISPSWWLSFAPHRVKSTWFMAHHGLESAGCQGLIIDKINHGHWTSNIIWLSSRDTTINALRRLVVSGLTSPGCWLPTCLFSGQFSTGFSWQALSMFTSQSSMFTSQSTTSFGFQWNRFSLDSSWHSTSTKRQLQQMDWSPWVWTRVLI